MESRLTQTISDTISTLKNNSLERRHYMTWAVKMADARYDRFDEGYVEGREEGISIGLEQGAYQKALETAKILLSYGDSPEKVASCTNLPLILVQEMAQN